jgi:Kef-type K+ transport system membrane component KefB
MTGSVFVDLTLILAVSALTGALGLLLRQPLIISFIFAGVLVGPTGLGWTSTRHEIELFATFGIALLLFVVGLKLDLHLIRSTGVVALATGLGQVAFTSIVGFFIAWGLGLPPLPALYVAVALTFSSTIIIVKLLSDKREIDSLHGRIAMGFLIVQDIVVVLVMILLSTLGAGAGAENTGWVMLTMALQGAGLLVMLALLMRFVLPGLLHWLARSLELLVLFAVAWAISLAALSGALGFSKEVGAFLAGVALASTGYREIIGARLQSLRDFLLLYFFVHLGAQMELHHLGGQWLPALVLSAFVLVGNPIIVLIIMGAMGYRKRTSFLAGLTVAQISEFSLILVALGLTLGHVQPEVSGLVTVVGLITIGLSTYMILYSHPLYERLAPWLSLFERRRPHHEEDSHDLPGATPPEIILFGLGRYGSRIAAGLLRQGQAVLAVDFDPEVVQAWRERGHPVQYGDAEDPDFAAHLPLQHARLVLCTVPLVDTNLTLLRGLRHHGYQGRVVLSAHRPQDARRLEQAGADLVLQPFHDAADRALEILTGRESGAGAGPQPARA